jgi:UDP-sugar pyrophosphorylase
LRESAEGLNPFEGYTPCVPDGQTLAFGTPEFEKAEQEGLAVAADTAFVLVAGGLGERLGYSGIKLSLPVEVTTRKTYLELYIEYILALQARTNEAKGTAGEPRELPLIIMTSQDTDVATREFLAANGNFGMSANQITIVMQEKVPALSDSEARLAVSSDDPFEIETKPHGHGDVHHLLYREGVAASLEAKGFRYLFFLQDTNALVLNSILPALGVSSANGYHMNSICVPRKAKEAAGAITALTRDDGSSLIINVEYNQLDPLLRATTSPEGDVNDPATGFSPFPGNVNTLVLELASYNRVLNGPDNGVVTEFVNPKYKDESRTSFKKPTRLECMMQDFPKLMEKEMGAEARIGFTSLEKWLAFSPAKNSLDAGAASAAANVPPGTASSAEAEFYAANVRRLATCTGAHIGEPKVVEFGGVPFSLGPRIIMSTNWALTTADLRQKLLPEVQISSDSTLVLDGKDIVVESLELDGTLIVKACPGANVAIRGLKVKNDGWSFESLGHDNTSEEDAIRGYVLNKKGTTKIEINEPGNYVVGVSGDVTHVSAL